MRDWEPAANDNGFKNWASEFNHDIGEEGDKIYPMRLTLIQRLNHIIELIAKMKIGLAQQSCLGQIQKVEY